MPRTKFPEFVDLVRRSQLLDDQVFDEALARYDGESTANSVASDGIARFLVAEGLLTEWQVANLLDRKYRGFFLGKYRLLGKLGRGGMSTVYLAEHRHMQRQVAIKVLPKQLVGETSYLARFYREARAFASLDHPNIVRAYDVDSQDDTHYLVMEYVDGEDLNTIVRNGNGRLDPELVAYYMAQAALGLRHIHEAGLVHRDIKPANLMINADHTLKILDMGIARFQDGDRGSLTVEYDEQVLGTADYLAPEQAIDSHEVDPRADIYSLGCTMYFSLTGRPPFIGGTLAQRIAKHQTSEPDDLRQVRNDCPNILASICRRMMAKLPEDRFASVHLVAQELATWLRDVNSKYATLLSVQIPPKSHTVPRRNTPVANSSGGVPSLQLPKATSASTHATVTGYVTTAHHESVRPNSIHGGQDTIVQSATDSTMPVIVVSNANRLRQSRRGRSQRTPVWLWCVILVLLAVAAGLWYLHWQQGGFDLFNQRPNTVIRDKHHDGDDDKLPNQPASTQGSPAPAREPAPHLPPDSSTSDGKAKD